MIVTDKDEGLHPWGDAENWQESCVLAWRDAKGVIGGNHRISIQPNRGVSNLWCAVFKDRDKIYRLNLENVPFEPMTGEGIHGFQTGPQRMFHDGKDMRLQLDTPECTVDLIIDDFKDSLEAFDDGGGMSTVVYRSHFNYHCQVSGTVVLNGVTHVIEGALGWRDHSWGPRDWSQNHGHRSFHGNFGADLNFHLLSMLTADGRIERRGHLVRNGVVRDFDSFTTRIELLEDGITPVRGSCHIFLDGEHLRFDCDVQKGVFAQVEMYQGFFGSGECHFEGRSGGYCNFETTINSRLGVKPLMIALGNTLENGYYEIDIEPWKYEPL